MEDVVALGTPTFAADCAAAARRSTVHQVKARARLYACRPQALDALWPGLGRAAPYAIVSVASSLFEREAASPRRWFGFGGEVTLVNARAALLLGRTLRRAGRDPK